MANRLLNKLLIKCNSLRHTGPKTHSRHNNDYLSLIIPLFLSAIVTHGLAKDDTYWRGSAGPQEMNINGMTIWS